MSDRGAEGPAAPAREQGRPRPSTPPTRPTETPTAAVPVVDEPEEGPAGPRRGKGRVRARKVRRVVRHVDPWSVLKVSVLFYFALFVILAVASGILWNAARTAGAIDDLESFITDVGGFGVCEPIDGAAPPPDDTATTTTAPTDTTPVDQFDPVGTDTTLPAELEEDLLEDDDGEGCREGERLVGEFQFEDGRIMQAFLLGGIVLVLAGTAANVVLALLFNLMSDLTGGVEVTVLEEEPARRPAAGSQGRARRG